MKDIEDILEGLRKVLEREPTPAECDAHAEHHTRDIARDARCIICTQFALLDISGVEW